MFTKNWIRQDKVPITLFPNVKSYFLYKSNHNRNLKLNDLIFNKSVNKIEEEKTTDDLKLYAKIWETNIEKFYSISRTKDVKFISLLQPFMGLNNVNVNQDLKSMDIELLKSLKTNNRRKKLQEKQMNFIIL